MIAGAWREGGAREEARGEGEEVTDSRRKSEPPRPEH